MRRTQQAVLTRGVRGVAAALRGSWAGTRVLGGVVLHLSVPHVGGLALGKLSVCVLHSHLHCQGGASVRALRRAGLQRRGRESCQGVHRPLLVGTLLPEPRSLAGVALSPRKTSFPGSACPQSGFPDVATRTPCFRFS